MIAILAASCSIHEIETAPGELAVRLTLKCADNQVRATEAGNDTYFENTIDHVDYFVYTSDATDVAAVAHARVSDPGTTCTVDLNALVSGGTFTEGDNCYIYLVANMPSEFTGTESVDDIRNISITTTDFDTAVAGNSPRFVMDTQDMIQASVNRNGSNATANLYRLAAKLNIRVNIPSSITVGEGSGAVTYESQPASLQVYYLYAAKTGKLSGVPMEFDEATADANYFNYPYNRATTVDQTADPRVGTCNPFYTYPEKWNTSDISAPYFKVVMSWAQNGDHANARPYYYKVMLPEAIGGRIDRNTLYKFLVNLSVLGSETDDAAVIVGTYYWAIDWLTGTELGENGAISRGKYLDIARPVYYLYGQDEINIPVTSSHDITATATGTYTDFSTNPPTTRSINASAIEITNHGRESFSLKHTLNSDITSTSLNCSKIEFDVTVTNEAGLTETTTIIQYPSLYIENEQSNNYVFINGVSNRSSNNSYWQVYDDGDATGTTLTKTYTPSFSNTSSYLDSDGGLRITFSNYDYTGVSITNWTAYYSMGTTNNNGIITISVPDGSQITNVSITYRTTGIIWTTEHSSQAVSYSPAGTSNTKYQWNGSTRNLTITMTSPSNQDNRNQITEIAVTYSYPGSTNGQSLGYIIRNSYSTDLNDNIYTISVSNLGALKAAGNNWYIADPREDTPVNIYALRAGGGSSQLTGYRPTRANASDIVAPSFKIASFRGATIANSGETNFEQAKRRCASFQENGYPAGRWRIPTEAEIKFCIYLSTNQKIPKLFNGTYWASSGNAVQESGNVVSATSEAVRCVYDAWYWGNEPVDAYKTTWSGWQTN